ncbi:MAG: hypothetical protein Q8R87_04130 [Anaerolineaceae bacterium]|nr:hypothetical protein [Anaerolineaceae bacterium]
MQIPAFGGGLDDLAVDIRVGIAGGVCSLVVGWVELVCNQPTIGCSSIINGGFSVRTHLRIIFAVLEAIFRLLKVPALDG